MKLTKIGKVVFTIITILISILVYVFVSNATNVTNSNILFYTAGWTWLIIGQVTVYYLIWEE